MTRKQVVFSTHMTRTELAIALILVIILTAIYRDAFQEHERNEQENYPQQNDGPTLWTLQRIAGALAVYYNDNHAFPYDPRGVDQALRLLCLSTGDVRVEYLNPAPGFEPLKPFVVLAAARPLKGGGRFSFYLDTSGGIYGFPDEQLQKSGIATLAGTPIDEAFGRLHPLMIDDIFDAPWNPSGN